MSFHYNRPNYPKAVRSLLLVMCRIVSILKNFGSSRRKSLVSQGLCAHTNFNFVLIGLKRQFLLWIICQWYVMKYLLKSLMYKFTQVRKSHSHFQAKKWVSIIKVNLFFPVLSIYIYIYKIYKKLHYYKTKFWVKI